MSARTRSAIPTSRERSWRCPVISTTRRAGPRSCPTTRRSARRPGGAVGRRSARRARTIRAVGGIAYNMGCVSLQTARPERAGVTPELRQRLRKRLADSPALGWLSPSLEELELDHCVLRLPYREAITNGSGTIHGGVLATLADSAVAFALATNFDGKMGFATTDLTIHFLRRAQGRGLGPGANSQEGEASQRGGGARSWTHRAGGRPGARDVSADDLFVRLRPGTKLRQERHMIDDTVPFPAAEAVEAERKPSRRPRRGGSRRHKTLSGAAEEPRRAAPPLAAHAPAAVSPAASATNVSSAPPARYGGRPAALALHRLREHRARSPRRAVQEVRHPAGPPAADREGPHRAQEGVRGLDALFGVQAGVPRGRDRADRHTRSATTRPRTRPTSGWWSTRWTSSPPRATSRRS